MHWRSNATACWTDPSIQGECTQLCTLRGKVRTTMIIGRTEMQASWANKNGNATAYPGMPVK